MAYIVFRHGVLYVDREVCLSQFRPPSGALRERVIFHAFWRGSLTRHHQISLRSLALFASPPFEIWLWVDEKREPEVQLPSSVKIVEFDLDSITASTPVEGELARNLFALDNPAAVSDLVRWLVLYRHGGMYFDLDMLFLRDPRPLTSMDFAYQWSKSNHGNSAICHIRKDRHIGREMLRRAAIAQSAHPAQVLSFDKPTKEQLYILPVFLFDPLWVERDTRDLHAFDRFFATTTEEVALDNFWPGAYAYHWHNRWERIITPESPFGRLGAEIDHRLSQRC